MALFEALACGVPVIVNDIPVFEEYISNKKDEIGIKFTSGDSKDLAFKIESLHNDTEKRNQMRLNSLKYVSNFSLTNYLSALNKLYTENGIKNKV